MHGQHSAVPYPIRNKPMKRDMQCGPEKIALSLVHRHFATVFAVFTKLLRYWWAGSKWRIKAAISVFMPGLSLSPRSGAVFDKYRDKLNYSNGIRSAREMKNK